jgi:hypothetical protein
MVSNMKWARLIAIALLAEAFTLAVMFGLPALQGRAFLDPRFPRVTVFHHTPPSCIVDFQGNVYTAAATSTLFWMGAVLVVALVVRSMRAKRTEAEVKLA